MYTESLWVLLSLNLFFIFFRISFKICWFLLGMDARNSAASPSRNPRRYLIFFSLVIFQAHLFTTIDNFVSKVIEIFFWVAFISFHSRTTPSRGSFVHLPESNQFVTHQLGEFLNDALPSLPESRSSEVSSRRFLMGPRMFLSRDPALVTFLLALFVYFVVFDTSWFGSSGSSDSLSQFSRGVLARRVAFVLSGPLLSVFRIPFTVFSTRVAKSSCHMFSGSEDAFLTISLGSCLSLTFSSCPGYNFSRVKLQNSSKSEG